MVRLGWSVICPPATTTLTPAQTNQPSPARLARARTAEDRHHPARRGGAFEAEVTHRVLVCSAIESVLDGLETAGQDRTPRQHDDFLIISSRDSNIPTT